MALSRAWHEKVADWPVARLATVRADGRPRVVPCCFILEGDTFYTAIDGKPKRTMRLGRLDDVRANPVVSVVVDHYSDEWSELWWARLDGPAEILVDGAERERALALLQVKYPQYRGWPPDGDVIAVRVERWKTWSWSGSA